MKITSSEYCSQFIVTVESGNAKITEDISGRYKVPTDEIQQFITVANEASRFNGTTDVDFVIMIINALLNESERQELIETLITEQG